MAKSRSARAGAARNKSSLSVSARRAAQRSASAPASTNLFRPRQSFQDRERQGTLVKRVPARRGRKGKLNPSVDDLPAVVSSYVDPWSVDADGVRYPDKFRGNSGTFTSTFDHLILTSPALAGLTDLNQVTVTPDPGTALFLYTPDPSNLIVTGTVGTGTGGFYAGTAHTFNWPNGIRFTAANGSLNAFGPGQGTLGNDYPVSNLQTLRAMYTGGRLVAGGVRLYSTQNFSTVSGTLHMAPVFVNLARVTSTFLNSPSFQNFNTGEMVSGWQTALPQNLQDLENMPGYMQFPMSSLESGEVTAVFKRFGEEAKLFKSLETTWCMNDSGAGNATLRYGNSDNTGGYGHYCLLVYVSGALSSTGGALPAGTALLEAEIRMHYECQPNPGTSFLLNTGSAQGVTTPSPPYQPLLEAASDDMCQSVPAIREVDSTGVEEACFLDDVKTLWNSAAKVASSVVPAVTSAVTALGWLAI